VEKYPDSGAKIRQDADNISTFENFFFPYPAWISADWVNICIVIVMYL
jgi:hypothetical protein